MCSTNNVFLAIKILSLPANVLIRDAEIVDGVYLKIGKVYEIYASELPHTEYYFKYHDTLDVDLPFINYANGRATIDHQLVNRVVLLNRVFTLQQLLKPTGDVEKVLTQITYARGRGFDTDQLLKFFISQLAAN